jgi:hypothetical protein
LQLPTRSNRSIRIGQESASHFVRQGVRRPRPLYRDTLTTSSFELDVARSVAVMVSMHQVQERAGQQNEIRHREQHVAEVKYEQVEAEEPGCQTDHETRCRSQDGSHIRHGSSP